MKVRGIALLGLVGALACKGEASSPSPVEARDVPAVVPVAPSPGSADGEAAAAPEPSAIDANPPPTSAEREAVPRAEVEWTGRITLEKSIGLDQPGIDQWRALAGRPVVPPWAFGEDAAAARDDDLLTGWSCSPTPDQTCAIGLALPEPATITALRLVSNTFGDGGRRIDALRIHSAAGHVDTGILPNRRARTVVFSEPVRSGFLAFEIIAAPDGDQPVRIAEIEVYGTEGQARAPLDLDPGSAHVSTVEPWTEEGKLRPDLCMRTLAPGGRRPCSLRATALYGRAGDRFLLAERIYREVMADENNGAYLLVDQHTRRVLRLDGFGRPPAPILVHSGGLGFGYLSGGDRFGSPPPWSGVRWKDGALTTWTGRSSNDVQRMLDGFEFFPRGRGGTSVFRPGSGACGPIEVFLDDARFDRLLAAMESSGKDTSGLESRREQVSEGEPHLDDAMWCPLGEPDSPQGVIVVGREEGDVHELFVVTASTVQPLKTVGSMVRASRLRDGRLLLAAADANDEHIHLHVVGRAGSLTRLAPDTGLAVPVDGDDGIDAAIPLPPLGARREPTVLAALARLPARAIRALRRDCDDVEAHTIWDVRIEDRNDDGHLDASVRAQVSATLGYVCELTSSRAGGYAGSLEMESGCDDG